MFRDKSDDWNGREQSNWSISICGAPSKKTNPTRFDGAVGGLKGTFPCPSFPEEPEKQMDYMFRCKTGRAGFAFRKATNARPRRPVPSRSKLLGSGVGANGV